MKAIVTVGLGFGDEGKGATVDFLTREFSAEVVVRYCGGSQAGHNVQLPDGSRHTFSQFGAGTLAGAKTYLGPRMIITPDTMPPEAEHLKTLGVADPFRLLSAHPECLVSTFYHATMNRLREVSRGDSRHGSCGYGIGEARHYWLRYGQDAIVAGDLRDTRTLRVKMTLLRDRFLQEMQTLPDLDESLAATLYCSCPAKEADELQQASDGLSLSHRIPEAKTVLFEGAQGVLLDEWKGFHPYTTWSTVTAEHAWDLTSDHEIQDVTVLGLMRAYATRHGAGPFPTHDPAWSARIEDLGNPINAWQGSLRMGPLDFMLLWYAYVSCPVDGFVVNNFDQLPEEIPLCTEYRNLPQWPLPKSLRQQEEITRRLETAQPVIQTVSQSELLERLEELAPVIITAHGPTHADRRWRENQSILNPPR